MLSEDARWLRSVVSAHAVERPAPPPPATATWVDTATRAGLLGVVAHALGAAGHPVPPELGAARFAAAALHVRTLADLELLSAVLDAAEVRWLVFKGPVLAAAVHRPPITRTYTDLDVLVHPADLRTALDALAGGTAVLLDTGWDLLARTLPGEISLRLPHGTPLDLHWHVVNTPRTRQDLAVAPARLVERRVRVPLGSGTFPTLDPLDTVLQVALHASLSGAHTLRWLLDVQQSVVAATRAGATGEQLAERADEHGLGLVLRCLLHRAGTTLDPSLLPLSRAVAPASAWTWLSARAAEVAPAGSDLDGRLTGRVVAQSTRSSTGTSTARLVRHAARMARHRVHPLPGASLQQLRTPSGTPADRDRWIRHAETWA